VTRSVSKIPTDSATLARWLAEEPTESVKALEAFVTRASASDYGSRREVVRIALRQAWDEQPDVFFALLQPWFKAPPARLRWLATGALPVAHEGHRDPCARALRRMATDRDAAVRHLAVELLGEDLEANLEALRRWVKDADPAVRATAARHLGSAEGEALAKALPLLEALGLDAAADVHWAAVGALVELYEREPRAVLDVARALATASDPEVRGAVAAGFFERVLADAFDATLPTLRSWLRSGAPELRWTLVRSLRFVRVTARSAHLLRVLYEDQDPEIRRCLVAALLDLFEGQPEARGGLAELLRRARIDPSKRVRELLEEGDARFGERFEEVALQAAEDGDEGGDPGEADDDDDDDE